MPNPSSYTPSYSYEDWQADHPKDPLPALQVDNDFASIAAALSSQRSAIMDIRRSDGKLQNGVVTKDSLSLDLVLQGFDTSLTALLTQAISDTQAAAASAAANAASSLTNANNAATSAASVANVLTLNDFEIYKGAIDASANPNYPAADAGATYRISVGGKIGGAAGLVVKAGDRITCNFDGTAAGTQAAVGAKWDLISSPGATVANTNTANTFTADQTVSTATGGNIVSDNTTSPGVVSQSTGGWQATMFNAAGSPVKKTVASMDFVATNVGSGTEAGYVRLKAIIAGALTEVMRAGAGVQLGAPTGGDPGLGWLNVSGGVKVNNVALSAGAKPLPPVIRTSGTSWTTDAKHAFVRVTVVGGGGGGGGGISATSSGAGGGGGGAAQKQYTLTPSTAYTYAVGAAGASSGAVSNGGNGGNSTFTDGVTLITGSGGLGGQNNGSNNASTTGLGGTGTNGDRNIKGAAGTGGSGATNLPGQGGASAMGDGGAVCNLNGGVAGTNGGGGSGAGNGNGGGAGGAGYVIFEEWVYP